MVKLRVLGTLDLRTDSGRPSSDLVGQPKRIALLAVLALSSTRGPISRDRLVGIFWPDLSQRRGRRALSQSLYVLRQSLGTDLFLANGTDALRLDANAVWCDAVEFCDAAGSGDNERALSLYAGDLLDGFHLADTEEFERWVDSERARLKRLAIETALELVSSRVDAGDFLGAARWARQLTRIDPWDEKHLIRLLGILAGQGDRSGVEQEFELYSRRMDRELGIEPSREVRTAYARALEAATPSMEQLVSATTGGLSPAPAVTATTRPVRGPWRIRALVGLAALVVLLFVTRGSWQATGEAEVRGHVPRVLIVPFANHSGDEMLDPLSRLAADYLSTEIARSGRVRVVPPVSALRLSSEVEVAGDTTAVGRAVAVGAAGEADLVLGGYVSGTKDSVVFEAFVLDPGTGELLFALDPVGPDRGATEPALERLRNAATGALAAHLDPRMRDWTGPGSKPPSYESYQEYSRALDAFLEVDWESQARAADLFVEAYRADTTFTAPLIWAVFAMWNSGQGDRADSVVHSLEPRADGMPEWDRAMLRYHLAFIHGDLAATYRTAAEVVALAPDSEWRWLLALSERAIGCRDRSLATLRDLGSRTGWMTRWSGPYWQVRLDIRHLLGDAEGEAHDANEALRELTDELNPGDEYRALAAHIRAAAVGGEQGRLESYLGQVRGLGGRAHRLYLKLLYWGPFDIAPDSPGFRTVLDTARVWYADRPDSVQGQTWYRFARRVLAYRAGEWNEADRQLQLLMETGWPEYAEYGYGPRAVTAARLGQADRARAIMDSLPPPEHGRSYADWDPDFFRARVEAILGEPSVAVQHLRAANRRGVPYSEVLGIARTDFESMWGYPPFQRLIATHSCEKL